MSLNASTLATAIKTAMDTQMASVNPASVAGMSSYHTAMATAIATAVVNHIKTAGVIAVGSLTVVTACPAGAGTGTGTGSGTIT